MNRRRAARGLLLAGALVFAALPARAAQTTTTKPKSVTSTTKAQTTASKTTVKNSAAKSTTTLPGSPTSVAPKPTTAPPTTARAVAVAGPSFGPQGSVAFIPGAGTVLDLGATEVAKLAGGGRVETDVRGASGLAASGTGTVILEVKTTAPTKPGKVTLTPMVPDYARPALTASVSFPQTQTTITRVAVPVGMNGNVRVDTTAGPTRLEVAVVGWITSAPVNAANEPSATKLETCRLLDTTTGAGGLLGPVTPAKPFDLPSVGYITKVPIPGSPTSPVTVLFAVAVRDAVSNAEVSVVPTGSDNPGLSISAGPGSATQGLFAVPVNPDPKSESRVAFYASAGALNLQIDSVGWLDKDGIAHSSGPC